MKSFLIALAASIAAIALLACAGARTDSLPPPDAPPPELRGKQLVADNGCASCHEDTFEGASSPSPGTRAYPPNLTPDPDTGLGGWSDDEIIRAIRTGVDDQGDPLCPEMPRFADLSDEDAAAIVAYLRSLTPVRHELPPSRCEVPN